MESHSVLVVVLAKTLYSQPSQVCSSTTDKCSGTPLHKLLFDKCIVITSDVDPTVKLSLPQSNFIHKMKLPSALALRLFGFHLCIGDVGNFEARSVKSLNTGRTVFLLFCLIHNKTYFKFIVHSYIFLHHFKSKPLKRKSSPDLLYSPILSCKYPHHGSLQAATMMLLNEEVEFAP